MLQKYRNPQIPPLKLKCDVIWVVSVLVIKTESMSEVVSEKVPLLRKLIYILAHDCSLMSVFTFKNILTVINI